MLRMTSVYQNLDYALFGGVAVIRPVVEVPVSVYLFSEHFSSQSLCCSISDCLHMEKWKVVIRLKSPL